MQVNITQSDKSHTYLLVFFRFCFLLNVLNCWVQKNESLIILAICKPPEGCRNPGFGESLISAKLKVFPTETRYHTQTIDMSSLGVL